MPSRCSDAFLSPLFQVQTKLERRLLICHLPLLQLTEPDCQATQRVFDRCNEPGPASRADLQTAGCRGMALAPGEGLVCVMRIRQCLNLSELQRPFLLKLSECCFTHLFSFFSLRFWLRDFITWAPYFSRYLPASFGIDCSFLCAIWSCWGHQ